MPITPLGWDTLAIMGTIGSCAFLSALWLSARFRSVEKLIYKEIAIHKEENAKEFQAQKLTIQRLELKAFGFTHVP